jgi:SAM-dependent methyltransferase
MLNADASITRVLFVGCDWYTADYPTLMRPDAEFWTIDLDPNVARYGTSRHICDDLANIGNYVEAATFDAILCNGVLGWGLDDRESAERAFAACYEALRPGGQLVLGWDHLPRVESFLPESLGSLSKFKLERSISSSVVDRDREHPFDFYRRPLA